MLNNISLNSVTPNTNTAVIVIGAYTDGIYNIHQDKIFDAKYDINISTDLSSQYNILQDVKLSSIYDINTHTEIYSIYNIKSASVVVSSYDICVGNEWGGIYNISAQSTIDDIYSIRSGLLFNGNYNIRASKLMEGLYNIRASSLLTGRYDIRHNVLTKLDSTYDIRVGTPLVSIYDLYYIPTEGELNMPGAKAELDKKAWLQSGHVVDNAITKSKAAIEHIEVTVESGNTEGTATVGEGAMVLGFVPTGNMDQYVDNINITDTTLTVALASAATADNTINVTVINA